MRRASRPRISRRRAGLLLPAAGAKGFGLAFFIEVLTGILSGGAVGAEVRSIYKERDRPNGCSHVFIAIDASRFGGAEPVADRVDRFATQIRSSEPPASMRSLRPGDLERAAANRNASATADELALLAAKAGVASPFD
jgi:LDH2 family malate/lactate/ureidoglycolate dehydrogenase